MFMSHVKLGCMDGQCCNNVTGDDAGVGVGWLWNLC